MLGKVKKVFFGGTFGILYISFIAQLVFVLGWLEPMQDKFIGLLLLSAEWFLLIAARYLSKRSGSNPQHGFAGRRR